MIPLSDLGLWFVLQLAEANFGLFSGNADGGGVAFFAHVGGFPFGVFVARRLLHERTIHRHAPTLTQPA